MGTPQSVTVEEIKAYKKVRDLRDAYFTNVTQEGIEQEQATIRDVMERNLGREVVDQYDKEIQKYIPTATDVATYKKVRDLMDNYFFILALGDAETDQILSFDEYQPPYIPTEKERAIYQSVRKLGDEYFAMLAQCR